MKPRLFLLDAVVVIELYKQGLWDQATQLAEVLIPGSVVLEAIIWYPDTDEGDPEYHETGYPIDLLAEEKQGKIQIMDMEQRAIRETLEIFDPATQEGLHIGELEALTYLRQLKENGENLPEFCTADRLAFRGICLLDMGQQAISLESLLNRLGLGRRLKMKFTDVKLREWVQAGKRDFVCDFQQDPKPRL